MATFQIKELETKFTSDDHVEDFYDFFIFVRFQSVFEIELDCVHQLLESRYLLTLSADAPRDGVQGYIEVLLSRLVLIGDGEVALFGVLRLYLYVSLIDWPIYVFQKQEQIRLLPLLGSIFRQGHLSSFQGLICGVLLPYALKIIRIVQPRFVYCNCLIYLFLRF